MSAPETFLAATLPSPFVQNTIISRTLSPLSPNEVTIKITSTAINPVDWKMRKHNKFLTSYPAILGSDASGIIISTHPSVSTFKIGDRVFFQGIINQNDSCTFQQYCKMPSSLIAKTPGNVSDEEAAGVSLASVAAVTGFYSQEGHGMLPPWEKGGGEVGKGKAVVIVGGASSVGQYAIQLAKSNGFERVVTNASSKHCEKLKELGAHVVLDRTSAGAEEFKEAIGETPLEFVLDAISAKETQVLSVQILQAVKKERSEVITLHVVDPEVVDEDAVKLGKSKEPQVVVKQVLGLGSSPKLRYLSEPLMRSLGGEKGWIAKGLFKPNMPRVVEGGLGAVEDALEMNRKGVSGVKVVIRPFDVAKA